MEAIKDLFVALIGLAMLFGGVGWLGYEVRAWQCAGYQNATGKQTRFVAGGCYVKDGDAWFMWEEYKNRFVANGELKK